MQVKVENVFLLLGLTIILVYEFVQGMAFSNIKLHINTNYNMSIKI